MFAGQKTAAAAPLVQRYDLVEHTENAFRKPHTFIRQRSPQRQRRCCQLPVDTQRASDPVIRKPKTLWWPSCQLLDCTNTPDVPRRKTCTACTAAWLIAVRLSEYVVCKQSYLVKTVMRINPTTLLIPLAPCLVHRAFPHCHPFQGCHVNHNVATSTVLACKLPHHKACATAHCTASTMYSWPCRLMPISDCSKEEPTAGSSVDLQTVCFRVYPRQGQYPTQRLCAH